MTQSLGFSNFRQLMTIWDEAVTADKIHDMLEDNDFVVYFKKGDEIFATSEEGRLTFARMKHPDDDEPEGYMKEATFSVTNLSKAIEGEKAETVFGIKDLPKLKILCQEAAEKFLKKQAEKTNPAGIKTKLKPKKDTGEDGMDKVDEK